MPPASASESATKGRRNGGEGGRIPCRGRGGELLAAAAQPRSRAARQRRVRRATWARDRGSIGGRGDGYMQIQAKTAGAYEKDGKTAKPNNSRKGGGVGNLAIAMATRTWL